MFRSTGQLNEDSRDRNARIYFRYLSQIANQKKVPFSGAFELTASCNFLCPMCYVHMNNDSKANAYELSADQWITLARDAVKNGTMYIMLTGGEPLLREDFFDIYNAIYDMGVFVSILSNASLMDESFFDKMEKRPPFSYSISIYGASDKTYEAVSGNGLHYYSVMDAVERIRKTKSLLTLKTTVIKQNIHDIQPLYKWAESEGIKYRFFSLLSRPRSETMRTLEDCNINYEQEISLWKEYQMHKIAQGKFDLDTYETESIKGLYNLMPRSNKGFHCTAANSHYWINWKGEMTPCALLDKPYEEPLKDSFQLAFNKLVKRSAELPGLALTECGDCNLRGVCHPCPAAHYVDTCKFGVLSNRVCERTKRFVLEHHCYYS